MEVIFFNDHNSAILHFQVKTTAGQASARTMEPALIKTEAMLAHVQKDSMARTVIL